MAIDPRTVLALLGNGSGQGQPPSAPAINPNAQAAPAQATMPASSMSTPLKGPGGGIDDLIPATVQNSDGSQTPAKLSPGEFVLPAATVSYMGDGDSDHGARLWNAVKTDPALLDKIKPIIQAHMAQQQAKGK